MARSLRVLGIVPVLALTTAVGFAGCATAGPDHRPARDRGIPDRGITVLGTGTVSVAPDQARLTVGAEAQAPSLSDATGDVARRMTAVLTAVKALGIDAADIRTAGYSIEPRMVHPRDQPPRIVGYHVVNLVQVRVRDLARVGPVLDGAVSAGANVVRGVSLTLQDPARAQAEALARAVADATAKAERLAAAAGVKLGPVVSVREADGDRGPPRPMIERALAMAPGPVEPGQLEVSATVAVRYRIMRSPGR
jgi:uncharacterized protein